MTTMKDEFFGLEVATGAKARKLLHEQNERLRKENARLRKDQAKDVHTIDQLGMALSRAKDAHTIEEGNAEYAHLWIALVEERAKLIYEREQHGFSLRWEDAKEGLKHSVRAEARAALSQEGDEND